jgi:hypothetical protein
MKRIKFLLSLIFLATAGWLFAQEIRVEPNTCITLDAGTTLDVSGGNLVLASDASGDASLIDFGTVSYSGGGQALVQRYVTEGSWHLISSPVAGAISEMFLGDYLQYHNESSNAWTDITSENYPLAVMQGYDFWSVDASPVTEVFSGYTNTGLLNKSFSQNGLGWNLMGNPYPSSIDWDAVTIPSEMNAAFWLFDPTIGANGDYVYYINGGGVANTTSAFIPSGQGFFVRATGGPGSLTFDNTMRAHNSQEFYKNSDEEAPMILFKAAGNGITTQTAIRFIENATVQPDRLYDVYRIMTDSPDVPMVFTRAEGEELAINSLPSIEGNEIVPLWFRAGMDGNYTISAILSEMFDPDLPVFLKDIENGSVQNIKETGIYSFDYKSGADRTFLVYFSHPDAISQPDVVVKIFSADGNLHVHFPPSVLSDPAFSAKIMVYDITGKEHLNMGTSQIENQISMTGKQGVFMVTVITDGDSASGKVLIK